MTGGMADAIEHALREARGLDAPLADQLRLVADQVRALSADFADAVDRFVGRLERAGAGETAPQVGEPMPDFLLPDQDGRLVSLGDLLDRGPVVVAFVRGHWCPYCRLNADNLARAAKSGTPVQIVAISAETQTYTKQLRTEAGADFPFLSDVDNGYALSLGVAIWVDDTMARMIAAAGWDIPAYQGSPGWVLPIPSVFVIGQDGLIVLRHVDPDYRRRLDLGTLLPDIEARLGQS